MPADPYIGEIYMSGLSFAPQGHALCQGQLLPIENYEVVYALLGTTFGGDGVSTFGLPDLRGRAPVGFGQAPGLTNRALGDMAGEENTTVLQTQMPAHTHQLNSVNDPGTGSNPAVSFLANTGTLDKEYVSAGTTVPLNLVSVGTAGSTQPHDNMPPYQVLTFYIVLEGIFPSR